MRELLFLFGGVIFWIIVFIVALLIFAGIITIIVFGIKTNVKKYNEVEKRMEKSAEERHREAEEKMNESAEKHAEKLKAVEEEMIEVVQNTSLAHIAIIMDGNGRWAKKRSLPRTAGHAAGAKTFKEIARYGNKIGLQYMTVYAFSTENWKRPKEEVDNIMGILRDYLNKTDDNQYFLSI